MKNYFNEYELKCKCGCGKCEMDKNFMEKLNYARHLAGIPFYLTSAYRCKEHNKKVGGHPNSLHMEGQAVDIGVTNNSDRFKIINALLDAGLIRIGVDKQFIHVDYGLKFSIWVY